MPRCSNCRQQVTGRTKDIAMATQQQFPLDPNTALTSVWMRNTGRKRHHDEAPALAPVIMQGEQLRSYAQMEAQSWRVIDTKERSSLLDIKWREANESIERRCQALRNAAAAGHVLKGEALALADNASFLRVGLKEVKEAVRDTGRLTQVESGACRRVPRAYASVASYFRAVNYEFNEKTFDQYLKALQEVAAFEMAELWQLKPFAEFVLLEALGKRANELEGAPYSGLSAGHAEDEPVGRRTADAQTMIVSLRLLADTDWKELFERISAIEQVLRKDPCGAYAQMDFESRDTYRKAITQLAERSKATEQAIAQTALSQASRLRRMEHDRTAERQSHVGYYLIGRGR